MILQTVYQVVLIEFVMLARVAVKLKADIVTSPNIRTCRRYCDRQDGMLQIKSQNAFYVPKIKSFQAMVKRCVCQDIFDSGQAREKQDHTRPGTSYLVLWCN